ncbi:hypothetical protein B0H10DRAFT_1938181 [Mycena sp. CBHHK59/15]|nr:hypothetical protein B0H10DRAFT_1938181 [Mycena sp. CBHHK59/15]
MGGLALLTGGEFLNWTKLDVDIIGLEPCPPLQNLLDKVHLLQYLTLRMSARGLTFASNHPHLSLNDVTPSFAWNDSSLPRLTALMINQGTIKSFPAFVSPTAERSIKQFHLSEMPPFHGSSMDIPQLLKLAPRLLEFAMITRNPTIKPILRTFTAQDLIDFFTVLDDSVTLQAVRFLDIFKYGSPLPPSLLEDLGEAPPSLHYIKWDVHPDPKIYCIEKHGKTRTASAMMNPPVVKERLDWTSESIFDHLS